MLKPKSIATLDALITDPKQTNTQAYMKVHNTQNKMSAGNNVSKLLKKPEAQIYLKKHIDIAKNKIVELTQRGKDEVSLRASQDILDRSFGKATTRMDVHTEAVVISLDLKSSLDATQDEEAES